MKRQSEQNLQTNIAENQAKVSEFDFVCLFGFFITLDSQQPSRIANNQFKFGS